MLALAGTPAPAVVLQESVVADAAAAVAQARHDGLRASQVAALMAVYRREAERLAAMSPGPQDDSERRDAALRALSEGTARGTPAVAARAEAAAWLGPLPARLDLLAQALRAGGPADLTRSIAGDVARQASAVMVVASYDASRADDEARDATTRAAALRAGTSPMERPALDAEVDLRALVATADAATAHAAELRALRDAAADLRDRARLIWER